MKLYCLAMLLSSLPISALDDVVQNGRMPAGATYTLEFTENLRFGSVEEEDAFLWGSINTDLAVNDEGHMFVADPKTNEIHEFDKNGKHVGKVAGEGNGPGELQAANTIQFLADGRLVAFESKPMVMPRLQFFDKSLAYQEIRAAASSSLIPLSAHLNPSGELLTGAIMSVDTSTGNLVTRTGVMKSSDFSMVKEFTSHTQSVDFQAVQTPSGLADMIGDMLKGFFKQSGMFAYDDQGHLFSALSNKYEIVKWSPDMSKELLTIRRDYKPIPNTPEEQFAVADNLADNFRDGPMATMVNDAFVKRVMDKASLPIVKQPIEAMAVTPEGTLLVVHDKNFQTGLQTADIFNKTGTYLGQVTMDHWAFVGKSGLFKMVFKKGNAYTIEIDDEEENQLVRYDYKLVKR